MKDKCCCSIYSFLCCILSCLISSGYWRYSHVSIHQGSKCICRANRWSCVEMVNRTHCLKWKQMLLKTRNKCVTSHCLQKIAKENFKFNNLPSLNHKSSNNEFLVWGLSTEHREYSQDQQRHLRHQQVQHTCLQQCMFYWCFPSQQTWLMGQPHTEQEDFPLGIKAVTLLLGES